MQALLEVNAALMMNRDLEKLFPEIYRFVRRVIGHDFASVAVYDEAAQALSLCPLDSPLTQGLLGTDATLPVKEAPAGQALLEGETKTFSRENLVAMHFGFVSQMLEQGTQSLCCIPLFTRKGTLGALNLASKEHNAFIGQDLDFLKQVAAQVAVALDNARAYRKIAERWVEFRHGSGVYVRETKPDVALSPSLALDQLVANLFRSARELGVPLAGIRSRIRHWLDLQPPDHFLLVEPDEELRKIVEMEMRLALTLPTRSCDFLKDHLGEATHGAIAVALPSKAKAVRQALPSGAELLTLQVRSVPSTLAGWLPAPSSALVGIASRWDKFLQMARTFLVAAGFESDTLIFRDAKKRGWQRGLEQAAAVICDSVTAPDLPGTTRVIRFQLLSESSLTELRRYEQFIRSPLEL